MIPKVIHYCWFGGKAIPPNLKKYIRSWSKFCPDYEIKLWSEKNFDIESHPFMKAAYDTKAWAFVSDYARLKIIYEEGGVYLDTDVELLKPLDELLENECYIGIEQNGNRCNTGLGFGAEIHSPVVKKMLDAYDHIIFNSNSKLDLECPKLNTQVIESLGKISLDEVTHLKGVTVYPAKFMDPLSTGKTENLLCVDSFSIHHYCASWTNGKEQFKRKIVTLLGDENYFKLKKLLGRTK